MNILFVGLNQSGVGTYWRMFHFARHLVQEGHAVTILSMSPQRRFGINSFTQEGVTVFETPDLLWGSLRSGWDIWDIVNRVVWMRQRRFDLIHAFETRPTVLAPALYGKYRQKTPLFFDWCDWFGRGGAVEERTSRIQRLMLRQIDTFFEEKFRHHASGTTVICETLRQKAIALGRPSDEICLIRDGASVEAIYPIDMQQARQSLGLDENRLIIGYIGAIYQRDAVLMADAFDMVCTVMPEVLYLTTKNSVTRSPKLASLGCLSF